MAHINCLRRAAFAGSVVLAFAAAAPGKPVALQGSPGYPARAGSVASILDAPDGPVGEPQFDTTTFPLAPNVPSLGFAATGTSEFGDHVRLSDTAHFIDSVTITMSSWALRSDYPGAAPEGFTHPITLRLYTVDRSVGTPKVGNLIASLTQNFLIPWRPAPDPTSSSPLRPWRGADGHYYPGLAFTLNFGLGSLTAPLPDELIYGISFDTQHHGTTPRGVPGPYDALHIGLGAESPVAGADVEPDAIFWKSARATDYADDGYGGVNIFRRDTGWTPFKPAVRFNNSAFGILAATAARLETLPAPTERIAAAFDEAQRLTSWTLERTLWEGGNRLRPAVGRLVFDLVSEAAGELAVIARSNDASGEHARAALASLSRAAEMLAEIAVGDALIGGGDPLRFGRAHEALDEAVAQGAVARFHHAIEEFATAWRESDLSLR